MQHQQASNSHFSGASTASSKLLFNYQNPAIYFNNNEFSLDYNNSALGVNGKNCVCVCLSVYVCF